MASDCIFCRVIAKEVPAYVIEETEQALAFLDVSPRSPGHAMVIPKTHSPTILDLSESEIAPLFTLVKKVAERIARALHADGLTIGINQGDVSGQTVKHLHVHIIPRFAGDGGGSIHSVVHNPPQEPLSEILTKIQTT